MMKYADTSNTITWIINSLIAPRYIISHGIPITYEIDTWSHWNCKTAADVYSLEYTSSSMDFRSYMSLTLDNDLQISAKNAGVYSLEYTSNSYGLPLIYEFDTW